jgi:aminoglycoside/choline kinase family phosphotransferase
MGPGLPEEAYKIGKAIVDSFAWVQDELSSKPHTFNHGDVKPPNMFMMPGEHPAFIDWQYTAVGKGCQDVVFFLIEVSRALAVALPFTLLLADSACCASLSACSPPLA